MRDGLSAGLRWELATILVQNQLRTRKRTKKCEGQCNQMEEEVIVTSRERQPQQRRSHPFYRQIKIHGKVVVVKVEQKHGRAWELTVTLF